MERVLLREPGFYWVKFKGHAIDDRDAWCPGEYGPDGLWEVVGCEVTDDAFDAIGPPIVRPEGLE